MYRMNEEERAKLKEMYDAYHRDVFNAAYHCLLNVEEAEDIVHDTFIKLARRMDDDRLTDNPRFWLVRVALNSCIDRRRSIKRRLANALSVVRHNHFASHEEQLEINDTVNSILGNLDPKTRAVLVLKYMEDMTYDEISKMMHIPAGTLKSISSRAISKIKKGNRSE
jgi:RNA polymerase sigma-70 factor (ECF subfamily)